MRANDSGKITTRFEILHRMLDIHLAQDVKKSPCTSQDWCLWSAIHRPLPSSEFLGPACKSLACSFQSDHFHNCDDDDDIDHNQSIIVTSAINHRHNELILITCGQLPNSRLLNHQHRTAHGPRCVHSYSFSFFLVWFVLIIVLFMLVSVTCVDCRNLRQGNHCPCTRNAWSVWWNIVFWYCFLLVVVLDSLVDMYNWGQVLLCTIALLWYLRQARKLWFFGCNNFVSSPAP